MNKPSIKKASQSMNSKLLKKKIKPVQHQIKCQVDSDLSLTKYSIERIDLYLRALKHEFCLEKIEKYCSELRIPLDLVKSSKLSRSIQDNLYLRYGDVLMPTPTKQSLNAFISSQAIMFRDISCHDQGSSDLVKAHHVMHDLGNLCFTIEESEQFLILMDNGNLQMVDWLNKREVSPFYAISQEVSTRANSKPAHKIASSLSVYRI